MTLVKQQEVTMEEAQATLTPTIDVESITKEILDTIEREREREIVARRFGLFDRRETLGQIGELLGITRERVRQLEKAVVTRLNEAAKNGLPHIKEVDTVFISQLEEMGKVARISDLTSRLVPANTKIDQARVAFLANLSQAIAVIDDNDHFYHSVGLASEHTEKAIREKVGKIIEAIREIAEPTDINKVAEKIGSGDPKHVEALASISKGVSNLHGRWGLTKWPMVNPKNIRDKIYVILHDKKKPMHFSEIAEAIVNRTWNLRS
jgi:DNA-directed RNA polymerase subunit H (RpoH/RPB5)